MIRATAKLRYLDIAPRKVEAVASVVRGMEAEEAKAQLQFIMRRSAVPLTKLIDSALANARHNASGAGLSFVIQEIFVTRGPMLKRGFPRSRGRVDLKRKRRSHVTVVLQEQITTNKKQKTTKKRLAKDNTKSKSRQSSVASR